MNDWYIWPVTWGNVVVAIFVVMTVVVSLRESWQIVSSERSTFSGKHPARQSIYLGASVVVLSIANVVTDVRGWVAPWVVEVSGSSWNELFRTSMRASLLVLMHTLWIVGVACAIPTILQVIMGYCCRSKSDRTSFPN